MFSTEGPIVEYFAEHNVMSYLQSGRLKYYIIKRTPGDTKTAKDNNLNYLPIWSNKIDVIK